MVPTFALASLALFLGLSRSMPTEIEARFSSDEVVYLSDCTVATSSGQYQTGLEAEYYSEINNSHNQQSPNAMSNVIAVGGNPSFAGTTHHFHFSSSGVTFTSTIKGGADGYSVGSYAGTGNNGKAFSCYRDNGQVLYERYGYPCRKQYFCRPN